MNRNHSFVVVATKTITVSVQIPVKTNVTTADLTIIGDGVIASTM